MESSNDYNPINQCEDKPVPILNYILRVYWERLHGPSSFISDTCKLKPIHIIMHVSYIHVCLTSNCDQVMNKNE